MSDFYAKHVAYAQIMATRPQTLYGLAASPIDLAAFMLDHGDGYWPTRAFFDAMHVSIPFAISVFPDELYRAPRSWAERAYPGNLNHYNKLDKGGRFAAWEQPQLFFRRDSSQLQTTTQIEARRIF